MCKAAVDSGIMHGSEVLVIVKLPFQRPAERNTVDQWKEIHLINWQKCSWQEARNMVDSA